MQSTPRRDMMGGMVIFKSIFSYYLESEWGYRCSLMSTVLIQQSRKYVYFDVCLHSPSSLISPKTHLTKTCVDIKPIFFLTR